jgi:hypothetical protein
MKRTYTRDLDGKGYFISKKQRNGWLLIAEFPRSINGNEDSALLLQALRERETNAEGKS